MSITKGALGPIAPSVTIRMVGIDGGSTTTGKHNSRSLVRIVD